MFPLLNIQGFSREACGQLARASAAAYQTPAVFEDMCSEERAEMVAFLEDTATDTQCYIARRGDTALVVFRGSQQIGDFITDAKFRRALWNGLSIHRGFAAAYNSVSEHIFAALLSLHRIARVSQLYIAGHSLGAALGTLFAYDAANAFPLMTISGVYLYGAPRVGDAEFSERYNALLGEETFRLVNGTDIVTRNPFAIPHICPELKFKKDGFKIFQSGYRHVGKEIFLDAFGDINIDLPWWRKIPSDIWGLVKVFDPVIPPATFAKLLRDHYMVRYINLLK